MERRHTILILGAILLVTIGSYAACSMDIGDATSELGGATHFGDTPSATVFDAGIAIALPTSAQAITPEAVDHRPVPCGETMCGADEICCRVDATCYPADCEDCCASFDERPAPRVEAPDPTVIPRDGLAGPTGGIEPPPDESPGMPPGVDRP
jgi:hypothetical protein